MQWIERYIYAVTKRLPESMREDVQKELRGQIEDMLGDQPDEKDIKKVLTKLGEPSQLATRYRGQERYLISPAYFDPYLNVLKIVLIILAVLGFIGGAIDGAINTDENFWLVTVFASLMSGVGSAISAMLSGFAIVTLIFVVLDYKKVELDKEPWTVEKLPELPKSTDVSIPKVKTTIGLMFETIFSSIFVLMLYRYQDLFGWYEDGVLIQRFFNPDIVNVFLPFLALSIVLNIVLHGFMIHRGYWNTRLAWWYSIYNLLAAIFGVLFITHPDLVHPDFISQIATAMEISMDAVTNGLSIGRRVIGAIIIIFTTLDVASIWYKVIVSPKKQKEALN